MKKNEHNEQRKRLRAYLEGLPHLAFSQTGIANIAKRQGVSEGDVLQAIDEINIARAKKERRIFP